MKKETNLEKEINGYVRDIERTADAVSNIGRFLGKHITEKIDGKNGEVHIGQASYFLSICGAIESLGGYIENMIGMLQITLEEIEFEDVKIEITPEAIAEFEREIDSFTVIGNKKFQKIHVNLNDGEESPEE